MNKELQQTLYDKYPKIFRQKDLSPKETSMCWGIECGDGWFLLIDCLCALIQQHCDNTKLPQIEAEQVKQKFGGLRFYTNHTDGIIDRVINLFENMSYSVCESCGSTYEVTMTKGWIRPICKKCLERSKKDYEELMEQKRGN